MKKRWILFIATVCGILLASVYLSQAKDGPVFPDTEQIEEIHILNGEQKIQTIYSLQEIKVFLYTLQQAQRTKRQSVSDVPSAPVYYTVQLIMRDGGDIRFFLYQEGDERWFLERPYDGIYRLEESSKILAR